LPVGNDDQLWLRPQQLRMIFAEGVNCWRVIDCQPSHAGWQVKLSDGAEHRLEVPASAALARGETIGLQLGAISTAAPGPRV
jgi:hypothetical protein